MIQYTENDVRALAEEINLVVHGGSNASLWHETIEDIKIDFPNNIKEMILDLIGPYLYGFTREYMVKCGLHDLIFNQPVRMMPLYIGSEDEWEQIVARWRLGIEK